MKIEILILSGDRQGEVLELQVDQFRVGSNRDDDVYFNPKSDPGAEGRSLMIWSDHHGWFLNNSGKEAIWVNQKKVTDHLRIRSGDLIRLSEQGPDLVFTLQSSTPDDATDPLPSSAGTKSSARSGEAEGAKKPSGTKSKSFEKGKTSPKEAVKQDASGKAAAENESAQTKSAKESESEKEAAKGKLISPWDDEHLVETEEKSSSPGFTIHIPGVIHFRVHYRFSWKHVTLACSVLVILLCITQGLRWMKQNRVVEGMTEWTQTNEKPSTAYRMRPTQPGQRSSNVPTARNNKALIPPKPKTLGAKSEKNQATEKGENSQKETGPPQDGISNAEHKKKPPVRETAPPVANSEKYQELEKAVFLIVAESPDELFSLPIGTCCAIGPNRLLTTAKMVTSLETVFRRQKFRIRVYNSTTGVGANVVRMKIPQKWLSLKPLEAAWYYNLGTLEVGEAIPDWATPSSKKSQEDISKGSPIIGIGTPLKEADLSSLTNFLASSKFQPKKMRGTVFHSIPAKPKQGIPRSLYLAGSFPDGFDGSPIFDARTKELLAVYRRNQEESPLPQFVQRVPCLPTEMLTGALKNDQEGESLEWIDVSEAELRPRVDQTSTEARDESLEQTSKKEIPSTKTIAR